MRAAAACAAACAAAALLACSSSEATDTREAPPPEITLGVVTIDAAPNVFGRHSSRVAGDTVKTDIPVLLTAPTWASTDTRVAVVNQSGLIAGAAPGSTTVVATSGVRSAAAAVTVLPAANPDYLVIAHRGFLAVFPENTLVAISGAFDRGADAVEIDIRLSVDGVPMVMHDATVDRTTNGTGAVKDLTAAQLAALNACAKAGKQWAPCPLPSLAGALAASRGRGGMLLHLYGAYSASDLRGLLAMVRAAGMERDVVFICFDLPTLRAMRQVDPVVPLGYLSPALPSLDAVDSLGRAALIPDVLSAFAAPAKAADMLSGARDRRLDNATYTITSVAQAQAAVKLGFRHLIADIPLDKRSLVP